MDDALSQSAQPAQLAQLVEAWRTNNRINFLLIDAISDEGMKCTLSKRGGRNVVRQFCHLHNVRLWQLEARAKDLEVGLHRFATKDEPDKDFLKECLEESGKRVEAYFERYFQGRNGVAEGRLRPFKKGVFAALSYFVSHESHHRGNILLTLKECGHNPDKALRYKIWDWDRV